MSAIEAASSAYAMAAAIDPQMPEATKMRIQAWAQLFEPEDIAAADAVKAVQKYYSEANRFPIKPGDIIAGVKEMPITSSPTRIAAFIARWSEHPYSTAIQQMTGMDWKPTWPLPAHVDPDNVDQVRAFHRAEFQQWIARHRDKLIRKALSNGEQLELL